MADTSITVQTVIDQSIARAKDADKTQWSDNDLLYILNQGVRYVADILVNINSELVMDEGTITIMADTQDYTLSGNLDDFWKPQDRGFYFTDEEPLTQITNEDKIRSGTDTTGTGGAAPTLFHLTGTSISLVKIPTSQTAASYQTLNCRYFKRPATLALTDSMPWKNILNDAIENFTTAKAVAKTTDPNEEYVNLYNALEEAVTQIVKDRDVI